VDAKSDRYQSAIRTVVSDPGVDMGVVILTPQSMTDIEDIAAVVPQAVRDLGKPVVCAFMGARDVAKGVEILRREGYPNYPFPEDAVRALAAMSRLVELHEVPNWETPVFTDVDPKKARALVEGYLGSASEKYLGQADCRAILVCYRLPLLRTEVATSRDVAAKVVEKFGKPVAMKIVSPDVVHKWDVAG
jgi:acyl-CoA synthetase (NDP forming)